MADDRYNDPFAIRDFSMGWSQWPVAGTELWAPLISGTQDWYGRFSFLTKQWDFFQRRVKENLALVEHFMSCRTPIEVWSLYTEFLQKAAADYQNEFSELASIIVGTEFVPQKPKKSVSRVDEFRRSALH
jgi:Phasin protein